MELNIKLLRILIISTVCLLSINTPISAQNEEAETMAPKKKDQSLTGLSGISDAERLRDEIPPHPTPNEIKQIRESVDLSFKNFIQLWSEEQYFELYELGKKQSKEFITAEEFAIRMVRLDWVPQQLSDETPFDISFRYRTLIYVDAIFEFLHKTNTTLKFKKKETFLLLWEEEKWRFDLLHMLRSPYYTPFEKSRERERNN